MRGRHIGEHGSDKIRRHRATHNPKDCKMPDLPNDDEINNESNEYDLLLNKFTICHLSTLPNSHLSPHKVEP